MSVDPLQTLSNWMEQARQQGVVEPEAMALATASAAAVPSVRIVLCRGIDDRGVSFYSNYESRKGQDLAENPRAAGCFLWQPLGRQVRVEGPVERLSAAASDAYFSRRPRGHQISAWVSAQSQPIGSIEDLRRRAGELAARYEGREVPRPPYWGGYLLRAEVVELWTQGADRLHERVRFTRSEAGWTQQLLSP
jgi:pyridoxamine 5'-phosphate oxidase